MLSREKNELITRVGPGTPMGALMRCYWIPALLSDYLQDREEQKRETFTGMGKHFLIHDSCATESMGPISDRAKEHLGMSDITVIAMRKFLLQCVRALDRGKEPPHVIRTKQQNDLRHIACVVAKIDSGIDPKRYLERLLLNGCTAVSSE